MISPDACRVAGNLLGVRDRVLLLIGFCGAFRRSELVALDAADVAVTRDGLVVTIRRSKTDQEGEGRKIGIPYASHLETCPVRSLQDWLEKSGITEGPLFRPIDRLRQNGVYPAIRCRRWRDREEICRRRGPGRQRVRRSQPAVGIGDECGGCWRFGTEHHESDRASVGQHGAAVYPRRVAVPGECSRGVEAVGTCKSRLTTLQFCIGSVSNLDLERLKAEPGVDLYYVSGPEMREPIDLALLDHLHCRRTIVFVGGEPARREAQAYGVTWIEDTPSLRSVAPILAECRTGTGLSIDWYGSVRPHGGR